MPTTATPANTTLSAPRVRFLPATAWTLAGNIVSSLAQWLTVMAVSRLWGYAAGGDYALALAIVNPAMMLANLQLRAIQAVDAAGRFSFANFLSLRIWTSLVAVIGVAAIAQWMRYPVLLAVLGLKVVEAVSDVYYGAFQKAERMDWIAQSLILRSGLSLVLLVIVAMLGQTLAFSMMLSAVGSALVWMWFDRGAARVWGISDTRLSFDWVALRRIAVSAAPLGVVMMLISLNQSIPRFALERFAGRETLGVFALMAALAQAVNLALNAIGQAMTTPLSRFAHEGRMGEFRAVFGKGFVSGVSIVLLTVLVCWLLEQRLLLLCFLGVGMTALAGLCGYALTALGEFRIQLWVFVPLTLLTLVLSWTVVPLGGIEGAAWAGVVSAAVHLLAVGWFLGSRIGAAR